MKCPECNHQMKKDDIVVCAWCREHIHRMNNRHCMPASSPNYEDWLEMVYRGYYLEPKFRNKTHLFWWNS